MPELPELQAHAERLNDWLTNRTLMSFRPLSFTALKTATPSPDEALRSAVGGVTRRGKHLLMSFPDGRDGHGITFVVHLMQGGRLRPDEDQKARPRSGIARWTFDHGPALLLTEAGKEKRAGIWVVTGDPLASAPLLGLGPEADALDAERLGEILARHSARLHGVLRDQRAIAGIGRRLANEVCNRAGLSPFANASRLGTGEIQRLARAITECIDESLAFERSRTDMSSSKERKGNVHHRAGERCQRCQDTVRSVEYRSYTVSYCPTCQTKGKILADNTTSKFLR